ncbi:protein translocase subunit SecD [Acidaminobacter sp. JC074]|uniref:protein translocase subunit SecD n=1 Tax=Acidaminobacter sp. JC074 TaxID=2530199 RepID=UPI001F0F391A|nr:protein translocase subunit SecD [Acidaminobacter sp. JC074]MCH4888306.1 protein translocase subunit SecD [Acidaminobacter sp. JC074]
MKSRKLVSLILIIAIVGLMVYTAFFGIGTETVGVSSVADSMKLGLDIQGGVVLEYEAIVDPSWTEERIRTELDGTKAVMSTRIDSKGLMEPKITVNYDKRRIRVEMPGVSDVNEAAKFIGTTAKLTFHKVAEGELIDQAEVDAGNVLVGSFDAVEIMDGSSIKNSGSRFLNTETGAIGYVVDLEMDSAGAKAFEETTLEYVQRESGFGIIAIAVDGVVISAPIADSVLSTGQVYIRGNMTQSEAIDLSLQIKSGALPLELEEVQSSLIGPTLGQDALDSAINAAKIGFILVVIFMLFYYRVPGLVASFALILYSTIILFTMVGLQATLTLPGVAGIVLGVGMAVDANVVIFERLKEELRNGKTVRASIKSGFKRAMRTIMDANITTLIAAVVLYSFGEGPIKGFATTLGIGIVASMFTAVIFTRTVLVNIDALGWVKNRKYFGA